MAPVGPSPRRLGGIGAIFFLGTLGGIAFYVQGRNTPGTDELVRKTATALPEVGGEEPPPAMPWKNRLDLAAVALTPLLSPEAAALPKAALPPSEEPPVDPKHARYVQELGDGHRILLTLDPVLQESALTIFRNREVPYAAAVMLDLRDNSVLALAGHSSMDPEVDPLEVVGYAWAPAASTFKLVTTAALLDTGLVTPSTKTCFSGGLHGIEAAALADVPGRDTRCETLANAVSNSYNLVIAKLALKHLDQQALTDTAHSLLFETEIPFDFNLERSPALIPADPTERAKVAAGFWNVDLSPVHAALLTSILARGGIYQPPHLIAEVLGPDGSDLTPAIPKPRRNLNKDTADALGLMMRNTTTRGTARKSFVDKQGNPYIRGTLVAGKTGSLTGKRAPYLNYNWFIGFAPADRPEIAFAVLLANAPAWRIKAHYAARRLVQIYLTRREAIAAQRDAKLTKTGLVLPVRDASGALVTAPAKQPSAQGEVSAKGKSGGSTPAQAAAAPADALSALPPPPGALPKPTGT